MRLGFPAAALALFMSAPASFAADAKTVAADLGALTTGSLAIDDAKVDAWLKATFTGDNACGDPGKGSSCLWQAVITAGLRTPNCAAIWAVDRPCQTNRARRSGSILRSALGAFSALIGACLPPGTRASFLSPVRCLSSNW